MTCCGQASSGRRRGAACPGRQRAAVRSYESRPAAGGGEGGPVADGSTELRVQAGSGRRRGAAWTASIIQRHDAERLGEQRRSPQKLAELP